MNSSSQFEEFRRYLPHFLSAGAQEELYLGISQFPDNIDSRMYTTELNSEYTFFQGDGVQSMPFVLLPRTEKRTQPAIILSNTCDISENNPRLVELRVLYAPIHSLKKYEDLLLKTTLDRAAQVSNHLSAIRKQRISHLFYLPVGSGGLEYEAIVRLDTIQNASLKDLRCNRLPNDRMFTLSNYGQYLFLTKLSIHFTRMQDGVIRN